MMIVRMFLGSPGWIGLLLALNIVSTMGVHFPYRVNISYVLSVDGTILQKMLFIKQAEKRKKADTCNIPEDLLMAWYMFFV